MEQTSLTGYPSIDRPWLKYYNKKAIHAVVPEKTVYQNIFDHNREKLDDIALQYFGIKISYRRMFHCVNACAKALLQTGIGSGDCFIICSACIPEAVYLILAASKIGAIANMLNPLFQTEEMVDRINECDAKALFVMDKMYPFVQNAVDKTCLKMVVSIPVTASLSAPIRFFSTLKTATNIKSTIHENQKYFLWSSFLKKGEHFTGKTEILYEKNRETIMVYSSGTTGASKGISLTNDGINATIANYDNSDFSYMRGNTFFQMIPIWFSTGIVLSVLVPLCFGVTVIPELVFSKESFAKGLAKHHPNMTLAATSLWVYAMNCSELKNVNLSAMDFPITGGEQVLPQIEKNLNAFLREHRCPSKLIKGWGMCELGSTITTTSPIHNKEGSAGYPILGVDVAAFSLETNEEMPYGQRGELRVSSLASMKGYYKNPEATNSFFWTDPNGKIWGHTGDIGYIDEDGDVFVLGRATDCYYTPDGIRVYLFDAERLILELPSVAQCKVVDINVAGVPTPVAHLILSETCNDLFEDVVAQVDIICKRKLNQYAIPQGYKQHIAFPVHSNGKLDNEALRNERSGYMTATGCDVNFGQF